LERVCTSTTLEIRECVLILINHLRQTEEHLRLSFKCFGRAVKKVSRNSRVVIISAERMASAAQGGFVYSEDKGNVLCVPPRPGTASMAALVDGCKAGRRQTTERGRELLRPAQAARSRTADPVPVLWLLSTSSRKRLGHVSRPTVTRNQNPAFRALIEGVTTSILLPLSYLVFSVLSRHGQSFYKLNNVLKIQ